MAMVKGYDKRPVVELNRIQAVKDGHHFTQYEMVEGTKELENGMLVAVDHVKGEIGKAKALDEKVYLHASVEHMYDDNAGRDEFFVSEKDDFLPRVYDLREGDRFETNAVIFDDTVFSDYEAIRDAVKTGVYGYVDIDTGLIRLAKSKGASAEVNLQVDAVIRLPNGTRGVKLVVL